MQTYTKPTTKPTTRETTRKPSQAKKYVASSVIALALFCVVNFVLFAIFGPTKSYSDNLWNGTGSIDLALADFNKLDKAPDVVLLGSSLIMYPFWSMDYANDKSLGDLFHHHRSYTLEKALAKDGKKPTVFSWAIFGQMASDSYIYANEFLKGDKKPRLVIWGIAPRDFSDAELSSPMNTISFQRLVNLSNFNEYSDIYLPSFQDKADFLFSRSVFLYGKRWHIQKEVNKGANKVAFFANPEVNPERKPGFEKKSTGGFVFTGGRKEIWEHSTLEYKRRYKNIDLDKLRIQLGFMDKLLKLSNKRDIKVLIVNMPLTATNRSLMPDGFYKEFTDELAKISKENGATFRDFGADSDFKDNEFWDTCHMSYQAGFKLVDKLKPTIENILSSN